MTTSVGIQVVHIGRALALPFVFLDDSIDEIFAQIAARARPNPQSQNAPIILLEQRYISLILVYTDGTAFTIPVTNGKQVLSEFTRHKTPKLLLLVTLPDALLSNEQLAKTPKLLGTLDYNRYSLEKVYSNQQVYLPLLNQEYNTNIQPNDVYIEYLYNKLVTETSEAAQVTAEIQALNRQRLELQTTTDLDRYLYDPLTTAKLETDQLPELVVTEPLENISQFEMSQLSTLKGRDSNFINIARLFEIYPLTPEIPFVGLSKKYSLTKQPMFRLHNSLKETTKPSDIKTWMIKEVKRKGDIEYKHIPEITFRHQIQLPIQRTTPYYLTITLNQKGTITVGLETELKKLSGSLVSTLVTEYLSEIPYDKITSIVNAFVLKLNKMPIFRSQNRIPILDHSLLKVDEYSTRYYTKNRINKSNLKTFLQLLERNKLLKYNSIASEDSVSFIYKPVYMDDVQVTDYQSWNVNVNVYDNKRLDNSSTIHISHAPSPQMARNILHAILLIADISTQDRTDTWFDRNLYDKDEEAQKLYRQTDIKELKAQGGIIDSRNCQEYRRPVLYKRENEAHNNQKDAIPDGFMEYNEVPYICMKDDYPYIGFTSKGVVCCFKKSQKHKPIYKQMLQSNESKIIVRPSNILVTIKYKPQTNQNQDQDQDQDQNQDYQLYRTFPLKQVTGKPEELGYYYFDPFNVYTRITDPNTVQMLNFMDTNNWLKEVPLYDLTITPLKTLCTHPPDILKQSMDVNAKCRSYPTHTKFGYTLQSIPCCFSQLGDSSQSAAALSKDYIKKTQTVLTDGTKGYISDKTLLGKFLQVIDPDQTYLRLGLPQDTDTIFHAIKLALQEYPTEKRILSGNEIRQVLAKYLANDIKNNDARLFNTLNNGTLASEFSAREYIKLLLDDSKQIPEPQLLDLITEYFDTTFLLYDTVQNYILCTPNINVKRRPQTIVLLRYQNPINKQVNYELLGTNNRAVFTPQDQLVRFLLDYYSKSCKRYISPPSSEQSNYTFTHPPTLKLALYVLDQFNTQPTKQVLNAFNQVYLLSTKYGIIPVEPSRPIPDIPTLKTLDLVKGTRMTYNKLEKHQQSVSKLFQSAGQQEPYTLHSKIVSGGQVIGVLLSTGAILPIDPTPSKEISLSESGLNWYQGEAEAALYANTTPEDMRIVFYNVQKGVLDTVNNVRKELVKYTTTLQKDLGKYKTIIQDTTISQFDKIEAIAELLDPTLDKITPPTTIKPHTRRFIRHLVAKEILQDPFNLSIIYGVLPDMDTDINSSKLMEIMDIRNYFAEMERDTNILERVL